MLLFAGMVMDWLVVLLSFRSVGSHLKQVLQYLCLSLL